MRWRGGSTGPRGTSRWSAWPCRLSAALPARTTAISSLRRSSGESSRWWWRWRGWSGASEAPPLRRSAPRRPGNEECPGSTGVRRASGGLARPLGAPHVKNRLDDEDPPLLAVALAGAGDPVQRVAHDNPLDRVSGGSGARARAHHLRSDVVPRANPESRSFHRRAHLLRAAQKAGGRIAGPHHREDRRLYRTRHGLLHREQPSGAGLAREARVEALLVGDVHAAVLGPHHVEGAGALAQRLAEGQGIALPMGHAIR